MGFVNEGHEFVAFTVRESDAPALVFLVEVAAHDRFVVFRCDGVSLSITFDDIASVLAVNDLCSAGHGVVTAPEFD